MAIATVLFWMGRNKFVHVPAGGLKFFRELFSREGLFALAKLIPLFLFIAAFWALYDQTGSSWVFQAAQMDRNFLGTTWLESQIQAVNPILILTFIPLFTFAVYPAIGRVFRLTPLRKIGIGFVLMVATFGLSALIQTWIDGGGKPSIGWQFLAYALITASEIMVSIVGLEFAYTQAPKNMKSMIMSLYLLSVFVGNMLTSRINHHIQIPSAAAEQLDAAIASLPAGWQRDPRTVILGGYDGITGNEDDFIARLESGAMDELEIPGQAAYQRAAGTVQSAAREAGDRLDSTAEIGDLGKDAWGNAIRYEIIDAGSFRIMSDGPDRTPGTRWDQGLTVTIQKPAATEEDRSWLARRKAALGLQEAKAVTETTYTAKAFSGGQTKLEGAEYFKFFTWLMLGTTVLYIPFALAYRSKTYLQD